MLSPLQIALVQTDLYWENKAANLAMLEEKLWSLQGKVDLIILPEMFPTGFSMDVKHLSEPMHLQICKWMQQLAAQTGAVLTGSAIIQAGGEYYNRLLWVDSEGNIQHYDKRHLFRMADEEKCFSMGKERKVFEVKGWKVLPQVCYDLRFPVWSRNKATAEGEMEYDLSFYIASWPAARVQAWDLLLQARAVENLSYTLGVNRLGKDGNGVPYNGHSAAYDFKGQSLLNMEEKERIEIVTLDGEALRRFRNNFPAWRDADDFKIIG